jgi:PilZ domain
MALGTATAPPTNRRSALRRQATLGTVCRLAFGPAGATHLGLVWNLSSSGVSMLLPEPPERDAVLAVELATTDDRVSLPITLRVVHVRPIRTGDFFLGAQFQRPLTPAEMRPFLAEPDGDLR